MCTQLQVVLHHLGVTSTLFWCKLTQIRRLHNTVLVFFYPIQIRIVGGSHYCGVNVHHVGVTLTLNWCSHSCKNLHFFGVTITLSLFLCKDARKYKMQKHQCASTDSCFLTSMLSTAHRISEHIVLKNSSDLIQLNSNVGI